MHWLKKNRNIAFIQFIAFRQALFIIIIIIIIIIWRFYTSGGKREGSAERESREGRENNNMFLFAAPKTL